MTLTHQRPEACNNLKRDSGTGVFGVNFAKFLRTPFLTEQVAASESIEQYSLQ